MTRSESKGLDLVVDLATDSEQTAAGRLRDAQHALAQAQGRLGTIQNYLNEYRERMRTAPATLAGDMREERRFLAQLEQTLAAQRQLLEQQSQATERARADWLALRKRRDGLETLVEQRARAATDRLEQVEQQQLDDRPLRQSMGRLSV